MMPLQHDFHTICESFIPFIVILYHKTHSRRAVMLPLWRPSHVEVGAVSFLSKSDGRFETLYNAFNPGASSGRKADELLILSGYGKVLQGNQRQDNYYAAQRGFDRVQGSFSLGCVLSFQLDPRSTALIPSFHDMRGPSDKLSALPISSICAQDTRWRIYMPRRRAFVILQIRPFGTNGSSPTSTISRRSMARSSI
jgi:hypothetical protein